MMQRFRDFADRVTRDLKLAPSDRDMIRDEIVDHLTEAYSAGRESGLSDEAAAEDAMARFGSGDMLTAMIDASMPLRRRKYEFVRRVTRVAGATGGVWIALALGAWFNFVDDAISGSGILSYSAWSVIYAGVVVLVLAGLIGAAELAFRPGIRRTLVSGIAVAASFVAAMMVVDLTGLQYLFYIHPNQTPTELAGQQFLMRLYLCWCPTLLIGSGLLARRRSRFVIYSLSAILMLGHLSALLWGARIVQQPDVTGLLGKQFQNFLMTIKWQKFTSTALMAGVYVFLTGLTAKVLAGRTESNPVDMLPDSSSVGRTVGIPGGLRPLSPRRHEGEAAVKNS